MKSIDFARLDLQDAIDLAILIEEEAAERYGELAEQMDAHHTPAAAQFFRLMIGYETRHGDELMKRRRELFGDVPTRVDPLMLWEVEAPEYEKVRAFMTRRQALFVALESEQKAFRFFADAILHITDASARSLFEELRDEELVHQKLVMKEIESLPDETELDPDFVDEPVAQ